MGPAGLEHTPLMLSRTAISEGRGAKSGARRAPGCNSDPDLASVVATWPNLPEHIRAAIVALVRSAFK